jgi:hypothetical protein
MLRFNNTGQIRSVLTNNYNVNGVRFTSVGTAPVGILTHLAWTFDGTWFRLFINGVEDPASPVDAGFSDVYYGDEDVLIGAGNFSVARRFDGIVDEVRIWDHARSEGEIAGQMNCALSGDEPGLLAYYSFNLGEYSPGMVHDDSGNGHDGLIEGSVDFVEMAQDCMLHFDGFDSGDLSGWQ